MKETGKGPAILRINNEKRVMAALRRQQCTTRQDLARQLTLSKNTVSLIIDDLIATGMVEEQGPLSSSGAGRRKIRIALRPERRLSAGIMIERQRVHLRVCDYFSQVLEERTWKTETQEPAVLLRELGELCQQLVERYPSLIGIALGFPGIIDPLRGWMHHSSHLGWQDIDLLTPLQSKTSVPLLIMNSVKAAALLAVQTLHLSPSGNHFYLRVGEGVGGAMVVNNTVYTGSSWTAGEVGHLCVEASGPICSCGRAGCLEMMISQPAIQKALSQRQPGLTWTTRFTAPDAVNAVMIKAGTYLGHALGQIILLLNPGDIIVDCPWNQSAAFVEAVQKGVEQSTLSFTLQHTKLYFIPESIDPANGLALGVVENSERPVLVMNSVVAEGE